MGVPEPERSARGLKRLPASAPPELLPQHPCEIEYHHRHHRHDGHRHPIPSAEWNCVDPDDPRPLLRRRRTSVPDPRDFDADTRVRARCEEFRNRHRCGDGGAGAGAGIGYNDAREKGGRCQGRSRRRCQCARARLRSLLSISLLAHMTTSILIAFGASICHIDAFGPPPLRSRVQSGLEKRQTATIRTANSLLSMSSSTRSDDSASIESTTTEITKNDSINPASTPPSSASSSSTNEYSFFDEAIIYVRAGSGGQGSSTYRRGTNNQNGPPDGGNGGTGGDVLLEMDESLNTLAGLARYAWRPNSFGGGGGARKRTAAGGGSEASRSTRVLSFRAENGVDGARQNKQGRNGKDASTRVPPGTIVQEEIIAPGDDGGEPTYVDLGTVTRENPTLLVATGGTGGEGSSAERLQRGVRRARIPPRGGERRRLKLTLKVVADVALVAVPNAGKSTLLAKVTRAKPKIANYPFTTVVPNLGVWVPGDGLAYNDEDDYDGDYDENGNPSKDNSKSLILCDVPGLIAGASDGVGLGHAFLRHVERCHVILHLLDATSPDALEEYAMINRELLNYGTGKLATMPQVVVVNKVDVAFDRQSDEFGVAGVEVVGDKGETPPFRSKEELENELQSIMPHSRLMWISAKEGEGVDDLMERVAVFVKKVKGTIAAEEERKKRSTEE